MRLHTMRSRSEKRSPAGGTRPAPEEVGMATTGAPSLERDAIGLPEVLFQSITHMAPAVATALSIGAATTVAGGITPRAVLFAMTAVLLTAVAMAELAKHLPSAGGIFTYTRNGLGSFFGWL